MTVILMTVIPMTVLHVSCAGDGPGSEAPDIFCMHTV